MNPSAFLPDPVATGPTTGAATCPFAALAQAIDAGHVPGHPADGGHAAPDTGGFDEKRAQEEHNVHVDPRERETLGRLSSIPQHRTAQEDPGWHSSTMSPPAPRSVGSDRRAHFASGSSDFETSPLKNGTLSCPMTGGVVNLKEQSGGVGSGAKEGPGEPTPKKSAASRWATLRVATSLATSLQRTREGQAGTRALMRQQSLKNTPAKVQKKIYRLAGSQAGSSFDRAASSAMESETFPRTQTTTDNQSVFGAERSVFGGSVAASSVSRQSKSKRNVKRAGGGGVVMGKILSRSDRQGRKTKPPPYNEEEMATQSKIVRDSWALALEKVGYFELGGLFYDTIFSTQTELTHVFTRCREEMAVKLVDMLSDIVGLCGTPAKLHDKVASLSTMHISKGVEASMMPAMGSVVTSMLKECLGKEWTPEVSKAWKYVWDWLTKSMALALEAADECTSLVQSSWDMAMDNFSEEELGGMLYDTLIGIAPNLKQMFHRPRQVMVMKFVEMVSTLVLFADDEKNMREQVAWLGARHVKYGAKPHHVPVLSQVLLTVMEQAVGEGWNNEVETAWALLWENACNRMMESIRLGEQHGHVVEDIWEKLKAKGGGSDHLALELGTNAVKSLRKSHPALISQWTECYSEWEVHENKRRKKMASEKASEMRDMALAQDQPGGGNNFGTAGKSFSQKQKKKRKHIRNLIDFSFRRSGGGGDDDDDDDDDEDGDGATSVMSGNSGGDSSRAFGMQIWELLEIALRHLWEPEVMNECLIVVASRWASFGLKADLLPDLGNAIQFAIQQFLETPCSSCKNNDWTAEMGGAWWWLWDSISLSLSKHLTSVEQMDSSICRECWDLIKEAKSSEEVGDAFFTELGRQAPHVVHLFQRPKKLQAYMWMQAVELLVVFTEVPEKFFEALQSLTIRHVKYGVKGEYVKPFGKAILSGLEELAGPRWTPPVVTAWKNLWSRVSTCVGRSLNVGTNLITVALVNGDVERFREAIECAPRRDRMSWVTRVEVYGAIMSPLYWAIRDGKFAIAQV